MERTTDRVYNQEGAAAAERMMGLTASPYANAKIDAAYANARGSKARPESELEAIASRIRALTANIHAVGHKLEQHADKVFGEGPKEGADSAAHLTRSGLIGSIHDALDALERARSYVANEADRNCTLA